MAVFKGALLVATGAVFLLAMVASVQADDCPFRPSNGAELDAFARNFTTLCRSAELASTHYYLTGDRWQLTRTRSLSITGPSSGSFPTLHLQTRGLASVSASGSLLLERILVQFDGQVAINEPIIEVSNAKLNLSNAPLTDAKSTTDGAALRLNDNADVTISQGGLYRCFSQSNGGAISINQVSPTAESSLAINTVFIKGNAAAGNGGVLSVHGINGALTVNFTGVSNVLENNATLGGAFYIYDNPGSISIIGGGDLNIVDNVASDVAALLLGNQASLTSSKLSVELGALSVRDNIITGPMMVTPATSEFTTSVRIDAGADQFSFHVESLAVSGSRCQGCSPTQLGSALHINALKNSPTISSSNNIRSDNNWQASGLYLNAVSNVVIEASRTITFNRNLANQTGGGIRAVLHPLVDSSIFRTEGDLQIEYNKATSGGGLSVVSITDQGTNPLILSSGQTLSISSNTALEYGGGMQVGSTGTVDLAGNVKLVGDVHINSNTAKNGAGAAFRYSKGKDYLIYGPKTVTDGLLVKSNSASEDGGAFWFGSSIQAIPDFATYPVTTIAFNKADKGCAFWWQQTSGATCNWELVKSASITNNSLSSTSFFSGCEVVDQSCGQVKLSTAPTPVKKEPSKTGLIIGLSIAGGVVLIALLAGGTYIAKSKQMCCYSTGRYEQIPN